MGFSIYNKIINDGIISIKCLMDINFTMKIAVLYGRKSKEKGV